MKTKKQNKKIAKELVKWLDAQPPIQIAIDNMCKNGTIAPQRNLS